MRLAVVVSGILFTLAQIGCLAGEGSDDPLLGGGTEATEEEDVAAAEEDGESTEDAESGPACEAPTSDLGVNPGQILDLSTELKDCEGNLVSLVDLACGANAILIDIGAQWCEPCKDEASHLEADIVQHFKDQGVVVISVITQDKDGNPATNDTCDWWVNEFGLTSPVVTDPTGQTNKWVLGDASQTMPVNIILDADFRIVSYLTGGLSPEELQSKIAGVVGGSE